MDPASSEKTYLRRFPCWWRKTAQKYGLHQTRLGLRPRDAPPDSSWAAPARRTERRSPRRRDPAGEAVPMILRLVDQPLAEAHKDHVQWTPRSGACSRSGASAVQAQAQALCDQALRQAHALRDQRHGAFPEVPSSAWFPGSPAPRGTKLAGSTLDQAPVAKAADLRHNFHFVRGGSPRPSRSVPLLLLSHGCHQLDDFLEH